VYFPGPDQNWERRPPRMSASIHFSCRRHSLCQRPAHAGMPADVDAIWPPSIAASGMMTALSLVRPRSMAVTGVVLRHGY